MTGITKSALFLSSYSPLFLILAIKYIPVDLRVTAGASAFLIASLLMFFWLKHSLEGDAAAVNMTVKAVSRRDGELLSYSITYFLPFLSLNLSNPYDLAAFLVLYGVIWLAYVRANAVHINPLFHIFGYRLFEVQDLTSNRTITLVTKDPFIYPDDQIQVKLETSQTVGLKV